MKIIFYLDYALRNVEDKLKGNIEEIKPINKEANNSGTISIVSKSRLTKKKRKKNKDNSISEESKEAFNFIDETNSAIEIEKYNYKYRLLCIKFYAIKFLTDLNNISTELFDLLDTWIIDSVHYQNQMMNKLLERLSKIVDNTNAVFTNPVTPGSVVKGASMLVGYNTGVISIGTSFLDECVKLRGVPEKCSSVDNLGVVDDITALAKSSNVYQFKTAIRVNGSEYYPDMPLDFNQKSFDTYRKMYHSFGLGVKTGIDLPVESKGYTSEDKRAGNLLDFVIGQYETYTPLQLSQYISTIANGGTRYQTHLLKSVSNPEGETIYTYDKNVLNKIDTRKKYMDRVRKGFYAVMHMPGGYGNGFISESLDASGKTGTSQSFVDTNKDGVIDTETVTSSFLTYFPSKKPKYSLTVVSPNSSIPTDGGHAAMVSYRLTTKVSNIIKDMYY